MRLEFERSTNFKALGYLAALLLFFVAIWACAYIFQESGMRRWLVLGAMQVGAAVALWGLANMTWLIASRSPAAVITADGIQIPRLVRSISVPWNKLGNVGRGFLKTGETQVEVVEVYSDKFSCIRRFPVSSLDASRAQLDEWIAAAQSRIKPAHI